MNSDMLRYKRALCRHLHCTLWTRTKLLSEFEHALGLFLEETPSPAFSQLEAAFGSPAAMGSVLMESVSEKERHVYDLFKKIMKILARIFVLLLLLFAIYSYYIKEYTIIEVYDSVVEVTYTDSTAPSEE